MKLINDSRGVILGDNIDLADTFFKRFLGLMFKKSLAEGAGLIIKPCNSIHMFFMRFPLDILFVDKNEKVIYILENFSPWKFSKIVFGAKYVVELPAHTISKTNTDIGDIIKKG